MRGHVRTQKQNALNQTCVGFLSRVDRCCPRPQGNHGGTFATCKPNDPLVPPARWSAAFRVGCVACSAPIAWGRRPVEEFGRTRLVDVSSRVLRWLGGLAASCWGERHVRAPPAPWAGSAAMSWPRGWGGPRAERRGCPVGPVGIEAAARAGRHRAAVTRISDEGLGEAKRHLDAMLEARDDVEQLNAHDASFLRGWSPPRATTHWSRSWRAASRAAPWGPASGAASSTARPRGAPSRSTASRGTGCRSWSCKGAGAVPVGAGPRHPRALPGARDGFQGTCHVDAHEDRRALRRRGVGVGGRGGHRLIGVRCPERGGGAAEVA